MPPAIPRTSGGRGYKRQVQYTYWPDHEILVLITRIGGLKISLGLHLHPYFVHASREGLDKSAHFQTYLSLYCLTMRWIPQFHMLAHFVTNLLESAEENCFRNYFMFNLHDSIGLGRDLIRDPWICSRTRFQLRYGAWPGKTITIK